MSTQAVSPASKVNWLALTSLVLSIGSFFFSPLLIVLLGLLQLQAIWEWYFSPFYEDIHGIIFYFPLSLLLSIAAQVTGSRSKKQTLAGRNKMAAIGILLGRLCLFFNVLLLILITVLS